MTRWQPDGNPSPGFVRDYARAYGAAVYSPRHGRWWWALIAGPRAIAGGHVATCDEAQGACDVAAERLGVA